MTKPNYSYKPVVENYARAYGRNLPVSTKTSIEMCSFLRGKTFDRAIRFLDDVLSFKAAVPFRRFTDGVGHRRGKMAAGRYPQKLSTEMKALLLSAKANADVKGLSDSLVIAHICAHKAATPFHNGRQRRRSMKRTHIELVLEEVAPKDKKVETQSSKTTGAQKPKSSSEKEKISSKPKVEKEVEEKKEVPKVEEKPKETPKVEEKVEKPEEKPAAQNAESQKPVEGAEK